MVVGFGQLPNDVTRSLGILVIVTALLPGALLLTAEPKRQKPVGGVLAAIGLVLAVSGLLESAQANFLDLRLALIDWRIFVSSMVTLAPLGCLVLGLAVALGGLGSVTARSGLTVSACAVAAFTAASFSAAGLARPFKTALDGQLTVALPALITSSALAMPVLFLL